jgi:hypothetical protein
MKTTQFVFRLAVAVLMTIGCTVRSESAMSDGYLIAASISENSTYLFDMSGNLIHTWNHSKLANPQNGYSVYLLPNGDVLRSAVASKTPPNGVPQQGVINEVAPDGKLVWTYTYSNDTVMLHHDMKPLPNGNVLAICYETKAKAQVIAANVDTTLLNISNKTMLAEKLVEIKPTLPSGGTIVWEWHIFDHTVAKAEASAHPELFSGSIVTELYYGQWVHLNGLDYDSTTDLIVFSSRRFSECYVLDHSTTTEEAKGHSGGKRGKGGDILYRWGKPSNYGASGATTLDVLHSTTWIHKEAGKPGNILFFHNNESGAPAASEVIEIAPDLDAGGNFVTPSAGAAFGPTKPTWLYSPKSDFYSPHMSTALRMPNGNTIAEETYPNHLQTDTTCSRVREIKPDLTLASEFFLKKDKSGKFTPSKIMYYPSSYEGIKALFLKIGKATLLRREKELQPCPFSIIFHKGSIQFNNAAGCSIEMVSLQGKRVFSAKSIDKRFLVQGIAPGSYITTITSHDRIRRMIVVSE